MVDNYFVEVRRRNKIEFHEFLVSHKDMSITQAMGEFSFRKGFKVSTLQMWLDEFIMAGRVKVTNNVIE